MARYGRPKASVSERSQKGIANILLVVLIGMGVIASMASMVGQTQYTREMQVSSHAATHTTNSAWWGVEAFRLYLNQLDQSELLALSGDLAINGPTSFGNFTVEDISIDDSVNPWRVTAGIFNVLPAAKASSRIEVVYEFGGACTTCPTELPGLNFYDDLDANGGIQFVTNDGVLPTINVKGDVNMGGVDITQIGELNTTGSVTLNSQVQVDSIYSNGSVRLDGAAYATLVKTLGNITTTGGTGIGTGWANGSAFMGGSRAASALNTLGTINLTSGDYGVVKGKAGVNIPSTGVLMVDEIESEGTVSLGQTSLTAGSIKTEGDVICPPADVNWAQFDSMTLNPGAIVTGCSSEDATDNITTDASQDLVMMAELTPFTLPPLLVDVWALKPTANYQFTYDTDESKMKVTVNNVNGIVDGTEYYIANYSDGTHNSYLCSALNEWGGCTAPTQPLVPVCYGHSLYNACISYDETTSAWTINGTGSATGILWFEGNLSLSTGVNYATILATGHVTTAGNLQVQAVNYGSYDRVCNADGADIEDVDDIPHREIFNGLYEDYYPTNLCDKTASEFKPIPTGNIGIAAGGFDPNGSGTDFTGGDIQMGALNVVYGSVLAGGRLKTAGDTTIYGYVAAAVQESGTLGRPLDQNDLSGSTVIDLTLISETFDPTKVPSMTSEPCVTDCEPATPGISESRVLWSRYL